MIQHSFAESHAKRLRNDCERAKGWDKRELLMRERLQIVFDQGRVAAQEKMRDALGLDDDNK